jgi:hypothetical protein
MSTLTLAKEKILIRIDSATDTSSLAEGLNDVHSIKSLHRVTSPVLEKVTYHKPLQMNLNVNSFPLKLERIPAPTVKLPSSRDGPSIPSVRLRVTDIDSPNVVTSIRMMVAGQSKFPNSGSGSPKEMTDGKDKLHRKKRVAKNNSPQKRALGPSNDFQYPSVVS